MPHTATPVMRHWLLASPETADICTAIGEQITHSHAASSRLGDDRVAVEAVLGSWHAWTRLGTPQAGYPLTCQAWRVLRMTPDPWRSSTEVSSGLVSSAWRTCCCLACCSVSHCGVAVMSSTISMPCGASAAMVRSSPSHLPPWASAKMRLNLPASPSTSSASAHRSSTKPGQSPCAASAAVPGSFSTVMTVTSVRGSSAEAIQAVPIPSGAAHPCFVRNPANAHYDRPAVLAALGPVCGRQVLDAACGPGLYLRELLERGAEVTAFDASPVMVSLARQQTAGRVRIDQAALGKPLPCPDDAFDLIVCALAIHYASDRAAAFAEFCRVLRPGGAAVVSTQHSVMDWLRKRRLLLPGHPGNRHLAYAIRRPASALLA